MNTPVLEEDEYSAETDRAHQLKEDEEGERDDSSDSESAVVL